MTEQTTDPTPQEELNFHYFKIGEDTIIVPTWDKGVTFEFELNQEGHWEVVYRVETVSSPIKEREEPDTP